MASINELIQILCCLHRTDWIKTQPVKKLLVRVKFTGDSYSYRTCVSVNGQHSNTCKLSVYWNSYTGTVTRTRINVNVA